MFVAGQNENVVEEVVDAAQANTAATTVTITTKEITLAQVLKSLKTSKPRVKGIVFQEPGIMVEESVKPKKKDQIKLDEETSLRSFKRVNTFKPIRSKLVKGKEKREGDELIQESTKKQKVEDDKEAAELKQLMEIIPNKEEVAINAIPLAVKSKDY
nr:hypothetical protein [Tanacetum cinerariifolium]